MSAHTKGKWTTGENDWNGGPNGYKKKATQKYWLKVKKELKVERAK